MVFSLFGGCAPAGAVVGGVFAGLWSLIWWPWTFWTFAIAMFALCGLSVLILPSVPLDPSVQRMSLKQKIVQLDLLGGAVGLTAMILFNFAINQAPAFGWERPYIYILLIIGFLIFPLFFWIEKRISPAPLIPFEIFNGDMGFVLGCIACGWAAFGIFIYYSYQIMQLLRSASPLLSVAQFSPVAISGMLAAIVTGKIMHRVGPAWVMFISMCAFLTGNILLATMPMYQTYWAQLFVCIVIIPWGMDMSFPAGTIILSNSMPKEHQGVAASLINTVVNYSISIGVGIAGTVEVHTNRGGRTKEDLQYGFRAALYMAIGLSGLGMALALLFVIKTEVRRGKERRLPDDEKGAEKIVV